MQSPAWAFLGGLLPANGHDEMPLVEKCIDDRAAESTASTRYYDVHRSDDATRPAKQFSVSRLLSSVFCLPSPVSCFYRYSGNG
jgi:hypothetical protein